MSIDSRVVESLKSAAALCAEFFSDVLIDWIQGTIIVNIDHRHFIILHNELLKRGFICIHETVFDDTVTCCYICKIH